MKDRLLKFLNNEQLSSARFAEIIGVQPSSVSHILSGRNKPGFDFIYKILTSYPAINSEWLITGKGPMLKDHNRQANLFSDEVQIPSKTEPEKSKTSADYENHKGDEPTNKGFVDTNVNSDTIAPDDKREHEQKSVVTDVNSKRIVEKIVIFYKDKSFDEYSPA